MAVALAALHLLLAWLVYIPTPFEGGDNATYLSLARSLLHGTGYREVWDPGGRLHALYPPVFPVMLAAAIKLGLTTEPALKSVVMLCSAAAVSVAFLWAHRTTTPGIALGIGLVLATAPGVLDFTRVVLSDVPFWTFAMVALWAFAHRAPTRGSVHAAEPGGVGWLIAGIVAVLLAHFTRSAGLPLVIATGSYVVLRRRWHDAAALGIVFVPAIAAWAAYGHAVHGPGYIDAFRFVDPYDHSLGTLTAGRFALRIGANVGRYLADGIPVALLYDRPSGAGLLGTGFAAVAIVGWARRLRQGPGLAELWAPLHIGLLLAWPAVWTSPRFVLPVLPPMLLYAAESVAWVGGRVGRPRAALAMGAAVLALFVAPRLSDEIDYGRTCSDESAQSGWLACLAPEWQAYFGLAEAVRGRLPAGAVVLARKPTIFYAISGYRSALYPLTDHPDSLFAVADSVGAEWVLADRVSGLAQRYLYPVVTTRHDDFCVVSDLTAPQAMLLRIDRGRTLGTRGGGPSQWRQCPLDTSYRSAVPPVSPVSPVSPTPPADHAPGA